MKYTKILFLAFLLCFAQTAFSQESAEVVIQKAKEQEKKQDKNVLVGFGIDINQDFKLLLNNQLKVKNITLPQNAPKWPLDVLIYYFDFTTKDYLWLQSNKNSINIHGLVKQNIPNTEFEFEKKSDLKMGLQKDILNHITSNQKEFIELKAFDWQKLSIELVKMSVKTDTIVSFVEDENFNQVQKSSIQKVNFPEYKIKFKSSNTSNLHSQLLGNNWIDSKSQLIKIPVLPNRVEVSSPNVVASNSKINAKLLLKFNIKKEYKNYLKPWFKHSFISEKLTESANNIYAKWSSKNEIVAEIKFADPWILNL